jgi:hypothetical protein
MWSLIKLFFFVLLVVLFIWFGRTVQLGKHTLFGHISRIWQSEETRDLVEGAKTSAGPALDEAKRRLQAGIQAASVDAAPPVDARPTETPGTPAPPAHP